MSSSVGMAILLGGTLLLALPFTWQQALCYVYSPEGCYGCHALAGSWKDRKQGRTMHGALEKILAQLRASLEALYGPRLVHLLLYGSQARGEATAESDIDILVVLHGSVDPGAEIARAGCLTASLSLQYNVVISCAFVAEERFRSGRSPFLLNVHREGVPV